MKLDDIPQLNYGWPVLALAGVMLGCVTMVSARRRAHLAWFLPVLLFAALLFVLFTDGVTSVLILAPERLGIGVMALAPAVAISCVAAWLLIRFGANDLWLFSVPLMICLLCTPLAGYLARLAVCELTGECP